MKALTITLLRWLAWLGASTGPATGDAPLTHREWADLPVHHPRRDDGCLS